MVVSKILSYYVMKLFLIKRDTDVTVRLNKYMAMDSIMIIQTSCEGHLGNNGGNLNMDWLLYGTKEFLLILLCIIMCYCSMW